MMEAFATWLIVVSFFTGLFGILNIIWPMRALRIRSRMIGVLILALSLTGCIAGGVIGTADPYGALGEGASDAPLGAPSDRDAREPGDVPAGDDGEPIF